MSELQAGARSTATSGILLLGALVSGGLFAMNLIKYARRARSATRHTESSRDKTLKDSFPASDPPASQYFDIPLNRQ